jgi:predicted RNase H-like nuclease
VSISKVIIRREKISNQVEKAHKLEIFFRKFKKFSMKFREKTQEEFEKERTFVFFTTIIF